MQPPPPANPMPGNPAPAGDLPATEAQAWDRVKQVIGQGSLTLGQHWSFNLRNDPKRFPFVLSRYKFAAKVACSGRRVLELGCSEGIGTPVLAEFAQSYLGVDLDAHAIHAAQRNFASPRVAFLHTDFLNRTLGAFDAVVSLDVVEHIVPDCEADYFRTLALNLTPQGGAVIGTPNASSEPYASPMSRAGHVNLFDGPRLLDAMRNVFRNVFLFGINDEVVHTGFSPMCHYLVAVGWGLRAA